MNKYLKTAFIIAFWLIVWTLAAFLIDNKILMVSPLGTAGRLIELFSQKEFYASVAGSFVRIVSGFFAGFIVACVLAALAARYSIVEEFLSPVIHLIKAVPVASFVVLLLIWWGSSFLSVAICFLVVLPNIYINTLEGLKSTDEKLIEMARVFHIPVFNRFFYIYRPALRPFITSGLKVALGMCFKSGVAAEVIGIPDYSIGERLYMSKLYLDTAGVFAWTAVIIILSVLFEKIMLYLTGIFFEWTPGCHAPQQPRRVADDMADFDVDDEPVIVADDLVKIYDGRMVIDHVNASIERDQVYCLSQPSGSGKTTFLKMVAHLVPPDGGTLTVRGVVSMMFQEDRLCDMYSAVKNVELICGNRERARAALSEILPADSLDKPVSELSGGMKRRVALVRAMEAASDIVLLDEPYTGLDETTRQNVKKYIAESRNSRTMLIVSHV